MKIHSGLNDPKHREAMGVRLWLFIHYIDKADWETGVYWYCRDGDVAEELDMPLASVRRWRHELRGAGYIRSYPGDQCQHIMILRWRNPRLVNPPQINIPGELPEMITPPKNDHPSSQKSDHPFYNDQTSNTLPCISFLERHFGLSPVGMKAQEWQYQYERGGAEIFERALILTVNAGGGHRMRVEYVTAIINRLLAERDGKLTFNERMALEELT